MIKSKQQVSLSKKNLPAKTSGTNEELNHVSRTSLSWTKVFSIKDLPETFSASSALSATNHLLKAIAS